VEGNLGLARAPSKSSEGVVLKEDRAVVPLHRPERVRTVIADSDPLARRVLRDEFQQTKGLVVAAEAADGVEAMELATHYRPDVVVSEALLPRIDGIQLTRQLAKVAPQVKVVIFTVDAHDELALRALRAGAAGVLSKDVAVAKLASALRGVVDGEAAISRRLTMRLIERIRGMPEGFAGLRPVKSPLTPREWEVLDLVSRGASTTDVARSLVLTEDTIYTHVKNIMRKLGVHTRADAIAAAERARQPLNAAGF
jgi:DNA-binding NarL/FixJ family response regulator